MQIPLLHLIHEQHLWLYANRYIYWEEQKAIILSDVHFGKTGHFRKHGIAIPQTIFKDELQKLLAIITFHKAEQLIVVGDLFHSHMNKELNLFVRWRNDLSNVEFNLIKGNHDILKPSWYAEANINISNYLIIQNLAFIHDTSDISKYEALNKELYFFSGHIHPGITIKGSSKQNLRFPCFYFSSNYCVLPAFSEFTGLAKIQPKKKDTIFAIIENSVLQIANY